MTQMTDIDPCQSMAATTLMNIETSHEWLNLITTCFQPNRKDEPVAQALLLKAMTQVTRMNRALSRSSNVIDCEVEREAAAAAAAVPYRDRNVSISDALHFGF